MPGDGHDHRLGDAGLSHVGIEGVPQVMEDKAALHKSSIGNPGTRTRLLFTSAPCSLSY